jgi:hypothetical protein
MAKFFRNFFEFAAGTKPLIITLIGVLIMLLLVFPALPINGQMIDLKLSYSLADIQAAMLQYGADGRAVYAIASATVDTLFPVLYVTFFAGLLYRFRPSQRLWVIAFLPVLAGVWDLCENAQIITMLVQYPDLSARQVAVASFFTSVKHLLGAVYEVTAVLFLLIFTLRRFRPVRKSRAS